MSGHQKLGSRPSSRIPPQMAQDRLCHPIVFDKLRLDQSASVFRQSYRICHTHLSGPLEFCIKLGTRHILSSHFLSQCRRHSQGCSLIIRQLISLACEYPRSLRPCQEIRWWTKQVKTWISMLLILLTFRHFNQQKRRLLLDIPRRKSDSPQSALYQINYRPSKASLRVRFRSENYGN